MAVIIPDFRFAEIQYEVWALGEFLEFLEPQIVSIREQDERRTLADLHGKGYEFGDPDMQLALQELHERATYVVPRFMRGPYALALWACFESSISEIADYHRKRLQARLSLDEIRSDNSLHAARRYFGAVLRFPLEPDEPRYARLADLLRVRNALAHGNGQQRVMSDKKWTELEAALVRQRIPLDKYRGVVVLTADYLKAAYVDVSECLKQLVRRSRAARKRTKAEDAAD